jgi:hypothetical protein
VLFAITNVLALARHELEKFATLAALKWLVTAVSSLVRLKMVLL